MAHTLDWSQCSAVESIPGKVSGAWVLRGTPTPVKALFENLEAGMSLDEVMEQFPVTRRQIDSIMAFIAQSRQVAVCVLHAFQKQTQATPKKDLEIAKRRFGQLLGGRI